MDYLYDGSFDGLLTCIYLNYYQEEADGIYPRENYQTSLIYRSIIVTTDSAHASRVYEAIEEKMSEASLTRVYRAFLSSCRDKENLILNYIRLGVQMGAKIDFYHSHPHVRPLHITARKVNREVERILGLLRFADNGSFLYASLSPDHDILPLIADHFAERMKHERFIIHDQKRNVAVIYDGHNLHQKKLRPQRQWYIVNFDHNSMPSMPEEDYYQELWKLYFSKICIDSRRNPRLQSQFIPLRYRKHLVEFQP